MKEYNSKNIHSARNLRKNLTPHEHVLWYHLRSRRFQNYKFRRQYPIGKYIADFCCFRNKIIVELDGGHHSDPGKAAHDARRDDYLKERGYVVLRYSNYDVDTNLEGVLESINAEL